MRILLLGAVSILLAGCLQLKGNDSTQTRVEKTAPKAKVVQVASPGTTDGSDCYTVDLFTPEKVRKPAKDVPEEYRKFLGRWTGGAWNNVWCHDLLVYDVHADGRADLVEMHAPYEPWNQPATAFNRVARIDKDGNLRFSQGVERTTYRIENGYLVGTRAGLYGNLKITLYQGQRPPIPKPKPMRLAQAASKTPGS